MNKHQLDTRRAWLMWAVATLAYVVAITQRTSFSVAGLMAGERFAAGPAIVSLFVVVQLVTYAGMQVPVGVLVDRYGTRRMLMTGAVLMGLGQLALSAATTLPTAIPARMLVGAGDAMTFAPALRLLPAWFSPRRLPVLNQVLGILGQLGQIVSAGPFSLLLHTWGWSGSFLTLASFSALSCALVLALLRDAPTPRVAPPQADLRLGPQLRSVWAVPQTRLAFWIHWLTCFATMNFTLMWGFTFLTQAQGLSPQVAAGFITLLTLAGVPAAPLIGMLSRRAPLQRSNLAFLITSLSAIPWLGMVLWPGPAPQWLLVLLMIGLAIGGPASSMGFDVTRTAIPHHSSGTAGGVLIMGGFTATLLNIILMGLILDALGGYGLDSFRWAMASQFIFYAIGVVGVLRSREQARRLGRARGVRYLPLWRVLKREVRNAHDDWIAFCRRTPNERERPRAELALSCAGGTQVRMVALLPGIAGRLTAIDVPPADADASWWDARVDDYLELVENGDAGVSFIEVRCPRSDEAARARASIAEALDRRGANLNIDVRSL